VVAHPSGRDAFVKENFRKRVGAARQQCYALVTKLVDRFSRALNKSFSALRKYNRIIIGGPVGLAAWGISGVGVLAIAAWGLKAALPALVLKAASWGIWGVGVLKESRAAIRGG
jgi:hypothetical protein